MFTQQKTLEIDGITYLVTYSRDFSRLQLIIDIQGVKGSSLVELRRRQDGSWIWYSIDPCPHHEPQQIVSVATHLFSTFNNK